MSSNSDYNIFTLIWIASKYTQMSQNPTNYLKSCHWKRQKGSKPLSVCRFFCVLMLYLSLKVLNWKISNHNAFFSSYKYAKLIIVRKHPSILLESKNVVKKEWSLSGWIEAITTRYIYLCSLYMYIVKLQVQVTVQVCFKR